MSWQGIEVVHVVAVDKNFCIGKNNDLPWHIPDDLRHFKIITQGGVMVMGRKNYDSIGRPLPNRINIVLTRNTQWSAQGVLVSHQLENALDLASEEAKERQLNSLFIIGGADIFAQTMDCVDRIEMTHIECLVDGGDVFYPALPANFECKHTRFHTDATSKIELTFCRYGRI